MEVRFYGVRGSIAVSGSHAARIGGNTSCVEVVSQGERLILDAGTGIRSLGEVMMREGAPQRATVLFSHLHWDHVQGFPFFTPGLSAQHAADALRPGRQRGPGARVGARPADGAAELPRAAEPHALAHDVRLGASTSARSRWGPSA